MVLIPFKFWVFFRAHNWQILCCLNPTTSPRFYNPAFILTNSAYIFELSSYECTFNLFWSPGSPLLRLYFLHSRHCMRFFPEAHTIVRHPLVLVLLHVKNKIHGMHVRRCILRNLLYQHVPIAFHLANWWPRIAYIAPNHQREHI